MPACSEHFLNWSLLHQNHSFLSICFLTIVVHGFGSLSSHNIGANIIFKVRIQWTDQWKIGDKSKAEAENCRDVKLSINVLDKKFECLMQGILYIPYLKFSLKPGGKWETGPHNTFVDMPPSFPTLGIFTPVGKLLEIRTFWSPFNKCLESKYVHCKYQHVGRPAGPCISRRGCPDGSTK